MTRLTLRIATKTLFGADVGEIRRANHALDARLAPHSCSRLRNASLGSARAAVSSVA